MNNNSSDASKFRKACLRLKTALAVLIYGNRYSVYSQDVHGYHNLSFSQEGEDLLLTRIFGYQENGFYVDVGAHHPQRFSNTYLFYLKGWRGINIDAMPGSMKTFNDIRSEDINIEAAISDSADELTYYMFNEPALNGFSETISRRKDGLNDYFILNEIPIKTQKLSEILDNYLPANQNIDFLSVDVEGLDYLVLKSNNWLKYKPKVILVEELSTSLDSLLTHSKTYSFLRKNGYELFSKTFNTSFYKMVDS